MDSQEFLQSKKKKKINPQLILYVVRVSKTLNLTYKKVDLMLYLFRHLVVFLLNFISKLYFYNLDLIIWAR